MKFATIGDFLAARAGDAWQMAKPRIPHAAAGALIGGGLGLAESKTNNDPLRQRIQELEGKEERSTGDVVNLAQLRARLTLGEHAGKHPGAAMGASAMLGGVAGATLGPELISALKNYKSDIPAIGKNLKGK